MISPKREGWSRDGIWLAADRWEAIGSRRGTVVLLHGEGQTRHSWQRTATLEVPTVVVRGGRSDVIGEPEVEAFLAGLSSTTVIEVPEAGHTIGGDENSAFVEALIGFLEGTFPEARDRSQPRRWEKW